MDVDCTLASCGDGTYRQGAGASHPIHSLGEARPRLQPEVVHIIVEVGLFEADVELAGPHAQQIAAAMIGYRAAASGSLDDDPRTTGSPGPRRRSPSRSRKTTPVRVSRGSTMSA